MSEERARYEVPGRAEIRRESRLPFRSDEFQHPTPEEFRELLKRAAWTGKDAAELAGVDGRTIRKYVGGERSIPYSVWRLLLIEAGLEL